MADTPEQRDVQRRRVIKRVTIAKDAQANRIPCVMKNVSEAGALLEFETDLVPPQSFVLTNELDGYRVPAELVWHDGRHYGIEFTGSRQTFAPTRTQHLEPGLAKPADVEPSSSAVAPQKGRRFGRRRS